MEPLLTVEELAKLIGKSERAIYADLSRGKWPHIKLGRRVFFRESTILSFLEAHSVPAWEEEK